MLISLNEIRMFILKLITLVIYKKTLKVIILVFLLIFSLIGKVDTQTVAITPAKKMNQQFRILNSKNYDIKSVFEYLDGGADLYLEYGFVSLNVQEISISINNEEISLQTENYKMANNDASYGIFSISKDTIPEVEKNSKIFYCQTNFQLQFFNGEYYIRIINPSGSSNGKTASFLLFEFFCKNSIKEKFQMPININGSNEVNPANTKLMFGKLGIQNGCPDEPEYYQSARDFKLYYFNYDTTTQTKISIFIFKELNALNDFIYQRDNFLKKKTDYSLNSESSTKFTKLKISDSTLSVTIFNSNNKEALEEVTKSFEITK